MTPPHMNIGDVPPMINRHASATTIINSEKMKKNKLLIAKNSKIQGSQKVLLNLINSNQIDIANLPTKQEELSNLCHLLEMKPFANLSMSSMKEAIILLYDSLETGASPCHQTGRAVHIGQFQWFTYKQELLYR